MTDPIPQPRVVFIGGTVRGYLTLQALIGAKTNLVGIISLQQDAHETRRYEQEIAALAQEHNIPCFETKWMKDRDYNAIIREWNADFGLVVGCRILIPSATYSIPRSGMLAVHDSMLPYYRGFAPMNWCILNGETETGVTLFYLDEGTDTGDIVAQQKVPIGPDDTAPVVYDRICDATVEVILKALPGLANGTAPRIQQDPRAGSITCARTPADGVIDWTLPTRTIYNKIRALTDPYPGAFTLYEGRKLVVWSARPDPDAPHYVGRIPGRVVSIAKQAGTVDVLTGDGVLRLHEVQLDGEGKNAAASVIHSIRTKLGV